MEKPPVDGSKDKAKPPAKPSIRQNTTFSWQDVGAWDNPEISDKGHMLHVMKKIEAYVIDHFYGDWYWNSGIMIGTCFFSWLAARWGFGIFSILVVLLGANSVYRLEFRRFNRDIRDDMTRIHASNRLENELETMEWMNSFLDKFWVIYMPALSDQVKYIANEVLKDQAPGMGIEKISLDEFTLGSKAPRVNSIKSYTRKGQDHIEMDWNFSFAPNDTDDMTKNEIKKKINPKVALGVTIGKAFISKSLPILVEDMAFTGRMNIKLKLTEKFPHVKMVSVQFLEAPTIDYALKPVGGDTFGFDIMTFIPGLSSFVNTLIHSNLRPMLYAPNSLDVDVEEIMAQQSNDSTGVVAVTVKRCLNLKTGMDTKPNSINPYVQIKLQSNADVDEKTKIKKSINDPIFLETKYLLVNTLDNNFLTFNVFDFIEDSPNDKLIGSVDIPLVDLLQKEVRTGMVKNLVESGKTIGKIEFDLRYFPTLEPVTLDDGSKEENTDAEIGIMKLNLESATNLDLSGNVIGLLNPYAEIYVNDELVKSCRRLRKTNDPSWNTNFESLISQQSETQIMVLVKDSANDAIVAKLDANLQDIIFETSRGQEWISCSPQGGVTPKIRITAKWKALGITDEKVVDANFSAPIGGLRLHVRQARDLKNLEAVGEVDPYVRVMVNGKLRARTPTIAETVSPVWNSVYFFNIDNENQHLLLSIMDAEPGDKHDRNLGSCAVHVKDFIKKNKEGNYLGYDGSQEVIEQPVLFNGVDKGHLSYSVSFIPNVPILTRAQTKNRKGYEAHKKAAADKAAEKRAREEKLIAEYPDKYEFIETDEVDVPEPPRISMPLEDIIKYRAGNMMVRILKARLSKPDLYIQTLFDDQALPSGVTPKAESRSLNVSSTAEAFIRDLPNSKLVLRVAKRFEVKNKKDMVCEKIFSTIDILKRSWDKPIDLPIDEVNTVKIQLEFIPSPIKLHPLDTILDVGILKLEILSGHDLPAADSNGKSDPLALIRLDGVEVFKTDKKRKNLDPVWNEDVEIPMRSRSRQLLLVEVYDWDLTHDDRLLGRANLDLSTLDPHTSTPFQVALDTKGSVKLRALFKPEYIRPSIEETGGLGIGLGDATKFVGGVANGVGGVASGVAGAGVGAAGAGVGAIGSGIGAAGDGLHKGGSFLKGLGRRKKDKGDSEASSMMETPSPTKLRRSIEPKSQYTNDLQSLRSGQGPQSSGTQSPSPEKKGIMEEVKDQDDEHDEENDKEEDEKEDDGQDPKDEVHPNVKQKEEPQTIQALPDIHGTDLPPPQKPGFGLERTDSSTSSNFADSSFASSIQGLGAIPGRLNIISAQGYPSNNLEVKVVLKTPSRSRDLYKTRSSKLDKSSGQYKWNEGTPFKCTPEGELIFILREHHTFGKKKEVDQFHISLSSVEGETMELKGQSGSLLVGLKYVS